MSRLFDDLKFSLRLLWNKPGYSLLSLTILVMGLTLHLTSYSIVRVNTDKPMPFSKGDRHVILKTINPLTGQDGFVPEFDEFTYPIIKGRATSFSSLGAVVTDDVVLSDGDYAQQVDASWVEPSLLAETGVKPVLGRLFRTNDLHGDQPSIIIIGTPLWENYYNSDPDVVGKTSQIGNDYYTIAGVMPTGFHFPKDDQLWFPLQPSTSVTPETASPLYLVGTLKQGITQEAATRELNEIMAQIAEDYPQAYAYTPRLVDSFASQNLPSRLGLKFALFTVTTIILALAALNLATLLFNHLQSRRHELAVRASVGASRWLLVRQVSLESFLIYAAGIVLSIGLANVLLLYIQQILAYIDSPLPFWYNFTLDGRGVLVAVGTSLTVWLATIAVVFIQAWRTDVNGELTSGQKGGAGGGMSVLITRLVVGIEVVFSCFLLVACTMFVLTMAERSKLNVELEVERYAFGFLPLDRERYPTAEDRVQFIETLRPELEAITGIEDTTFSTAYGVQSIFSGSFSLPDRDLSRDGRLPTQGTIWIDEQYLPLMTAGVHAGRNFTRDDNGASPPVAIIDTQSAERVWPGESPLGKVVTLENFGNTRAVTVVGVIEPIRPQETITFFRPIQQQGPPQTFLIVKTGSGVDPMTLEMDVKRTIARVDQQVPLHKFSPLSKVLNSGAYYWDSLVDLFVIIALATVVFACIGIFGVIARSILAESRDTGIRRALGASDSRIVLRYLRQGLWYLAIGAIVGCGGAVIALTPFIQEFSVGDPSSQLLAPLAITLSVGILILTASYLPARASVAIETGDALRVD